MPALVETLMNTSRSAVGPTYLTVLHHSSGRPMPLTAAASIYRNNWPRRAETAHSFVRLLHLVVGSVSP